MFKIYYDVHYFFNQPYPNIKNIDKKSVEYSNLMKDTNNNIIPEYIGKLICISINKKYVIFKNFDNNIITHIPIQYVSRLECNTNNKSFDII
jgi:hypothetical protein